MLTVHSPFFRRSEAFHPREPALQDQLSRIAHTTGSAGPVQTTYLREYNSVQMDWHTTLGNLGVPFNPDSLSGSNAGSWNMMLAIEPSKWERSYAASAYYLPVAARPNLHLVTEAYVTKVLIEPHGNSGSLVATGVQVCKGGKEVGVKAAREVILSAGTVQSPQLLELSGIGPRDVLEAAGIPVKFHNPNVGENLQDHTSMACFHFLFLLNSQLRLLQMLMGCIFENSDAYGL